ncbi:MAG: cell division FtsA domain-containing protein [Lachnospira sp.]|nr:cell division FtsA domain-containing protein [Lachnospira sp.]
MADLSSVKNDLVFGLDIGTRSIVGVVGYLEHNIFHIAAMAQAEHDTRSMLDGQIHDIYKVGDTIRRVKNDLERQLGFTLTDVCIAAAGRVLKTIKSSADVEFEDETRVNSEHIYSLNLLAVEKAHSIINENSDDVKYYCVGNTPITYKLNSFEISSLEGHKANKIGVTLIATFLPEEVVDGLYESVEYAGLHVASLTLEPIAAMNIAIPEQYRLLNIGLIDVGAGTSDICITKDGSVIAYGMIPLAGDELTEVIAKHYLVDFNTAEKIKLEASKKIKGLVTFKDIMGLTQKVQASEVRTVTAPVIEKMAKECASKIKELNGGKSVNAVFVVGGGGKMRGYTDKVAACLGIAKERVAVRGEEVLTTVDFGDTGFMKDSLYVTPVGICTNYYTQKNSFVFVNVNNERIKMYDNNHLTVVDAVMQIGFPNDKLFPRRGEELEFTVNGKSRLVRGTPGEGAEVFLNGKRANLNSRIEQNDVIEVHESTAGEPAHITIGQLEEYNSTITFIVNDKKVICPRFAYVNGELKSEFYDIQSKDSIQMESYYTVEQLFTFLDYDISMCDVYVNNDLADNDTLVYENFNIKTVDINESRSGAYGNISDFSENDSDNSDTSDQSPSDVSDSSSNNGKASDEGSGNDLQNEEMSETKAPVDIVVLINGTPVTLKGKSEYILVDLFQFYEFDLSKPQGNVVLNLNGETGEYTAPLKDGDVIDLYWEKP